MEDINKVAYISLLLGIDEFIQLANKQSPPLSLDFLNDLGFEGDIKEIGESKESLLEILRVGESIARGFSADSAKSPEDLSLNHIFSKGRKFKIDTLNNESINPEDENLNPIKDFENLLDSFKKELESLKNSNTPLDQFSIDFLLKKYTSLVAAPHSEKISFYEYNKARAIFSTTLYKLYKLGKSDVLDGSQERDDFLMICGDFFGIQKFIFDGIEPAKASKILRAKSAYVQLITKGIAFYIVQELGLSYQNIISTNAGKFEILGVNDDESKQKIKIIQKRLNDFFIETFSGVTGVGLSYIPCSQSNFTNNENYKKLRDEINAAVEDTKFKKFDLLNIDPIIDNEERGTNNELRSLYYNRDAQDESRENRYTFVDIGKELTTKKYLIFTHDKNKNHLFEDIFFSFSDSKDDDAFAVFDISNGDFKERAKWELASFVAKDNKQQILTFEDLAKNSVKEGVKNGERDHGVEAIMSLKGDVDNMGNFIKNSNTTNSFAQFNFFSRMVDYFFSVKASQLMEGKNLYTIFAGGDDIFILGAWDEVVDFAKILREEFKAFVGGGELTLCVGLVLTKPNKPVNFIAHNAEEALEKAKNMKNKDSIAIFGGTVKWNDYLDEDDVTNLQNTFKDFDDTKDISTGFLYRLFELSDMSKKVLDDPINTMWKSKLSYTFNRNILEKTREENKDRAKQFLGLLNQMIEKKPSVFDMILSEHIYKRRR